MCDGVWCVCGRGDPSSGGVVQLRAQSAQQAQVEGVSTLEEVQVRHERELRTAELARQQVTEALQQQLDDMTAR